MEGALSKDMARLGEYPQTWKLNLDTAKMVSAVFHLNNKKAKRELKVNFNNETLPFCSEPKYLGVTLDRQGCLQRVASGAWHPHLKSVPPDFTFGSSVAAFIKYCILKNVPPLLVFGRPCC